MWFSDTSVNIRTLTFGLQTRPETYEIYIWFSNSPGNKNFYIQCTNTAENNKAEILKPHETNQLAAGLLAPLFVAALMFV
jgi:hypothetical protein